MTNRTRSVATNWEEVFSLAEAAGAKFPELVAAQFALESDFGRKPSGKNNVFGLKSATSDGGTVKTTTEYINGQKVTIKAKFKDFDSLEDCVNYLVRLWYRPYENYAGLNTSATVEEAAKRLVKEGYATDPAYSEKLLRLVKQHALKPVEDAGPSSSEDQGAVAVENAPQLQQALTQRQAALFTIEALHPTFLKKSTADAADLPENEKVAVPAGRSYGVLEVREVPGTAHAAVELAAGAGRWVIYRAHWREHRPASSVGPVAIDWSNFGQRVTPHLTVGEILQYDSRRRPAAGSSVERRILATAQQFEAIRMAWGKPIGVTSFYRPADINAAVGGVPNSRHITGEAIDIYPIGLPVDSLYQWLRVRWTGGLGDGRHRGFLHIDTRNGGHFVPGAGVRPYVEFGY